MLMRKFIFFLTLLGTAFGLSAAEAPDAVRVTPVTGEPVVFMFSANPEITYTATGAKISTTSQDPVTFDFEAIEFYRLRKVWLCQRNCRHTSVDARHQ